MIEEKNINEPQNPDFLVGAVSHSTVFHGDCLEIMKSIPDRSIDMILCDLPYGTTACKWDTIIPFDKLWEQYERIIKPNGAIVLTAGQPFTSYLLMSNPKLFKYEWIYQKEKGVNFITANKKPMFCHENVLVFYKNQPTYNPQKIQGQPYERKQKYCEKRETHPSISKSLDKKSDGLRFPITIQRFKRDSTQKLHPTQKPVALFEYLIKTYTNEGDIVLDNCAGSGTTGIACINTNRNYILIEKEQKYFDIINERIDKHKQQRLG